MSVDVTVRQLEMLSAVVEHGSITEAARALIVSPGAISLAITQLEASLGVQVAIRTRGRGVEVTAAGREVYEHAREIAESLQRIRKVAAATRGGLTGALRLGLFTTLSPWLFPPIAEHFDRSFPDVDLQLVEGGSAELQDQLAEGRLDAALLYENHVSTPLETRRLAGVRLQLALAASHPLASYDAVPLAALRDEDAVLLAMRPASDHVEAILRIAGMTPRVRWRSANVETIRSLVARGLGYTIIMGRPYGDLTYEGMPVVYRPILDDLPANALVLAVPKGGRPTAKLRELTEFCAEAFGDDLEPGIMPTSRMGRLS